MTFRVYNKQTHQFAKLAVIDALFCRFIGKVEDPHYWGNWYHALECPFYLLSKELDTKGEIGKRLGLEKAYIFTPEQVAKAILIQSILWSDTNKDIYENIDFYKSVISFLYAVNDLYEFHVHH